LRAVGHTFGPHCIFMLGGDRSTAPIRRSGGVGVAGGGEARRWRIDWQGVKQKGRDERGTERAGMRRKYER